MATLDEICEYITGTNDFPLIPHFRVSYFGIGLYHPVTVLPRLAATKETGLLHPVLCQQFTEKVFSDPETDSLYIAWNDGRKYRLSMLE